MIRVSQIEDNFRNSGHPNDDFRVELMVEIFYDDEEKAYQVAITNNSDVGQDVQEKVFTTEDVAKAFLEAVDSMS